jgi:hypothetical protein
MLFHSDKLSLFQPVFALTNEFFFVLIGKPRWLPPHSIYDIGTYGENVFKLFLSEISKPWNRCVFLYLNSSMGLDQKQWCIGLCACVVNRL